MEEAEYDSVVSMLIDILATLKQKALNWKMMITTVWKVLWSL